MHAVLDANVVVRAVLEQDETCARWIARLEESDFHASVPDLLFPEVGQAFLGYLKSGELTMTLLQNRLELIGGLPFRVRPTQELVATAVHVAAARKLSVYDACYAVLAEADDAVLVTGDVSVAEAVKRAELV